jgi:tetratricopeptide (TPR) repeat protein
MRRREWNWAEREYRAALAKHPDDPTFLNNLGVALLNQGSDEEALEYFTRAGQLDVRTDLYRKNTATAAHRRVGGHTLVPEWARKVLMRHRYRGLSPAARTALEIDGATLVRGARPTRWRRWAALWLVGVVAMGVSRGRERRPSSGAEVRHACDPDEGLRCGGQGVPQAGH